MKYSVDFKNKDGELITNMTLDTHTELLAFLKCTDITIVEFDSDKVKVISDFNMVKA